MRAGSLNQRCVVQKPTRTTDLLGAATLAWSRAAETWCSIWPMSGTEGRRDEGVQATVSHEIRMRKRSVPAMAADWRILVGSRVFDVVSVLNVEERGEQWRLSAIERPA